MPLKDLMEQCPQPAEAQINVRCRHCLHFKDVAYYRIEGKATVCSNERIGRRENDVPCPNYATNMNIFRRMTPAAIAKLVELLAQMEIDADPAKRKGRQLEDIESMLELSLVLRAMINARKAGFEFGAEYAVSGQEARGQLVALGRQHGTIRNAEGIPYTVDRANLTRA